MSQDHKPYDTAFKDLAEEAAETLLRLVGALPLNAKIKPLPREMSAPALLADQPYEVDTGNEKFIAHVEAQTFYRTNVPERVVEYDALLWINYHLPVHSFVLIFSPDGCPPNIPTTMTLAAGGLTLTARFSILKLWEISAADALSWKEESLLPFIPLMKGGETELEQSALALGQLTDEIRRQELALHFLMLGSLRYNRQDVLELLRRTTMFMHEVLRETPYYQFILDEGKEEGRDIIVEMICDQVAKHFPSLNFKTEIEQIHDLSSLKQLYFDLDRITEIEAFRKRLTELANKN